MQVPLVILVMVPPLTEQIEDVLVLKLTGNPEVAVALTAVVLPIAPNVLGEKRMGPILCGEGVVLMPPFVLVLKPPSPQLTIAHSTQAVPTVIIFCIPFIITST
jgi:hypothetical protein